MSFPFVKSMGLGWKKVKVCRWIIWFWKTIYAKLPQQLCTYVKLTKRYVILRGFLVNTQKRNGLRTPSSHSHKDRKAIKWNFKHLRGIEGRVDKKFWMVLDYLLTDWKTLFCCQLCNASAPHFKWTLNTFNTKYLN